MTGPWRQHLPIALSLLMFASELPAISIGNAATIPIVTHRHHCSQCGMQEPPTGQRRDIARAISKQARVGVCLCPQAAATCSEPRGHVLRLPATALRLRGGSTPPVPNTHDTTPLYRGAQIPLGTAVDLRRRHDGNPQTGAPPAFAPHATNSAGAGLAGQSAGLVGAPGTATSSEGGDGGSRASEAVLCLQLGENTTANDEAFTLLLNERDDGVRTKVLQQLDLGLRTSGVVGSKILAVRLDLPTVICSSTAMKQRNLSCPAL